MLGQSGPNCYPDVFNMAEFDVWLGFGSEIADVLNFIDF